ncbi:hlh transcription factor [Moniliophthora roreri MCA 2997]|uniref:Hlh transcription factor n=2 Tax=Moniliophthora roreri TaxID=221103 RepID=V2XI40_MONRO|nr:hlh transcription factor [Moniliophthora roreri MCA 2997]
MALRPPVPYNEFDFAFDPHLSHFFPNPPPVPPSGELFSHEETSGLFNFLEGFDNGLWEDEQFIQPSGNNFNIDLQSPPPPPPSTLPASTSISAPYSNPHLNTTPEPSTSKSTRPKRVASSRSSRGSVHAHSPEETPSTSSRSPSHSPPTMDPSASPELLSAPAISATKRSSAGGRNKSLLSTPQKRLNHIMSEQKRRNAIRDGYAQLIALLSAPGVADSNRINMPTRGRPKGSGSRKGGGTGGNKGKSGVLFRAVEYCRWLEEGKGALKKEVERLEREAGIRRDP